MDELTLKRRRGAFDTHLAALNIKDVSAILKILAPEFDFSGIGKKSLRDAYMFGGLSHITYNELHEATRNYINKTKRWHR